MKTGKQKNRWGGKTEHFAYRPIGEAALPTGKFKRPHEYKSKTLNKMKFTKQSLLIGGIVSLIVSIILILLDAKLNSKLLTVSKYFAMMSMIILVTRYRLAKNK